MKIFDFISKTIFKFRWLMITAWICIIIIAGIFAGQLTPLLSGGGWTVEDSGSLKTNELLSKSFTGRSDTSLTVVIKDNNNSVDSSKYEDNLNLTLDKIENNKELNVDSIYSYLNAPIEAKDSLVGDDNTTIAFVGFTEDEGYARNKLPNLQKELTNLSEDGLEVYFVGAASFWGEINILSQEGLLKAELITLPLILIILLLVFRSVISAVVPLIVSVVSIITTLGLMTFLAQQTELSIFVTNAATMLGLGVGIDYSLFIVNRFKEEIAKHGDKKQALKVTMNTAGEAVFFSAITIIVCMSVLFLVDLGVIQSIAIGAIAVVSVTLLVSMTLLPTILYLLGTNINKGEIRLLSKIRFKPEFWYNHAHKVMKRPVLYLVIGLIILGVMAIPVKDLKTFTPDARILPTDSETRTGYEIIQNEFGEGFTSPIFITIESKGEKLNETAQLNYISKISEEIIKLDDVETINSVATILNDANVEEMSQILKNWSSLPIEQQGLVNRYIDTNKEVAIIEVISETTAASNETRNLVSNIDAIIEKLKKPSQLSVYIGGETAEGIDSNNVIDKSFIKVLVVMLVLGYFILLFTFRSVLLPLKAILMNLISLGATYGILILVFQYGFGSDILNFTPENYVQNFVPILLLTLLFSLSTDYEVFLISRIKEEYSYSLDNEESVAKGIQATAPMISGAAILMIAVFGAFTLTSVLPIQQLGLGMAVAIALDATIVRLILVPVSMKLMSSWNWWLPGREVKMLGRVEDEKIIR